MIYAARRSSDGAIKIGMAADPRRRMSTLLWGKDYTVSFLGYLPGGFNEERDIHMRLFASRLVSNVPWHLQKEREWFAPTKAVMAFVATMNDPQTCPIVVRPKTYSKAEMEKLGLERVVTYRKLPRTTGDSNGRE